ncbi:TonB-dependent receptor, partial [Sphingobium mellinum]|uniref:TonB-dependent receptor n=1 Tax=Sphingobium mellinum TaxID=1387166 RepID=UPI0030EE0FC1
ETAPFIRAACPFLRPHTKITRFFEVSSYERYGIRGSVALKTGGLTNNLMVDYYHTDGSNTVPELSAIVPNAFPIASLYAGVATPQDRATGIATIQAFVGPAGAPFVPAFYDAYFAVPNRPGMTQLLAEQKARGPYTVSADGLNVFRSKNWVVTNKTTLAIGDNTEIRNIIGYTHLDSFNSVDEGTPYDIADNGPPGSGKGIPNLTKQFSEELQLAGKAFDDRLTYVVGGYYSDESYNNANSFFTLDILLGGFSSNFHYELQNKTYAGYAQGTYALNDTGLSVTVGGRYTSEKVRKLLEPDDTNRIALGNPAPAGYSYDKSRTFNKFSWTLGVQEQFDAHTLLYAMSRRAYKSGGFNGTATPLNGSAAAGGDSVESEQVTDVEVGLKHQSNSGGVPKRINIAAYHEWMKDRQTVAIFLLPTGAAVATVNVPTSKVYGLEVDGSVGPISGFTLGGTFNYTHARFGSDLVAVPGPQFVKYDTYPDTPKFSGSAYVDYVMPVSGSIEASLHGEVYAQSKVNVSVQSLFSEGSVLPGYALVNFRAGLEDHDAGWSLTANLKNAFNKIHYVGGIPFGGLLGFANRLPGDPRTITVEARYKF